MIKNVTINDYKFEFYFKGHIDFYGKDNVKYYIVYIDNDGTPITYTKIFDADMPIGDVAFYLLEKARDISIELERENNGRKTN
jgi:hypothetical protein